MQNFSAHNGCSLAFILYHYTRNFKTNFMKKILVILNIVFLSIGTSESKFNRIETYIKKANLTYFEAFIKKNQLNTLDKKRLIHLNNRVTNYYKKKLYAAKSLSILSKKQVILLTKSFVLSVIAINVFCYGILQYLLHQKNCHSGMNFITIINSCLSLVLSISSLMNFLKAIRYPAKLQRSYNQSLKIGYLLFKCTPSDLRAVSSC